MKNTGKRIGWGLAGLFGLLLLALGYLWMLSPGQTPAITDGKGRPVPHSIAELTRINLNGAQQWICLRGYDRRKPVLLFLHGGPGLPELPLLTGHALEKQFVVVNWEQRGAGKSYDRRLFNDTFTVSTLVDDAVQLSRYLANRFNQPRIYLMAHSYGTFLGILAVQKHPELYQAFFSISQVARQAEAEQLSYDWVVQQARQQNDYQTVDRLKRHGRPMKLSGDSWLAYLTWQRKLVADYHGGMYRGDFYPLFIKSILRCPEYTLADKFNYAWGAQEAVRRLWPTAIATDLNQTVPKIAVPYYLFQGVHDYQTPYRIAKRYFDHVQAPEKRLFTFVNSAHSPIFEEPERFMQFISELVPQRRSE